MLPTGSSSPHELVRFFRAPHLCGPLFASRSLRICRRHDLPLLGFCAPPPLSLKPAPCPTTCKQMTSSHRFPATCGSACGFSPPRRVSCFNFQAYCIPVTVLGFATFPGRDPRCRHPKAPDPVGPVFHFPQRGFHTPRRIPLTCSRTASLQPLPSCCYRTNPSPRHLEAEASKQLETPPKRCLSRVRT